MKAANPEVQIAPAHTRRALKAFWVLAAAGLTFSLFAIVRAHGEFQDSLGSLGVLALGDTREAVQYKLGYPPQVYGQEEQNKEGWEQFRRVYYTDRNADPVNAMPEKTTIAQYDEWSYRGANAQVHLDVRFDKADHVDLIECFDQTEPPTTYCPRPLRLFIGLTEARLLSALGVPTDTQIKNGVKTIQYADLGLTFLLKTQYIYAMSVSSQPAPGLHLGRFWNWLMHG